MTKRLADSLWEELADSVGREKFQESYGPFRDAYRLFAQAAMTFESGAFDAVGLMCRSTLEAACYLFLTRKKHEQRTMIDAPMTLDHKVRVVQFDELKRGIQINHVLSREQHKKLDRIQNHGNIIAHLAARHDRDVTYSLNRPKKPELWLSRSEALEDLQDTLSIVATLAKSIRPAVIEKF